jgi:Flp pilus assembly protein TadG
MTTLHWFKTPFARLARSEKGTSLVEFAVVLPVMIFLVMGLIEVGRYAYFGILAANAARAGVQYGAQDTTKMLDTPGIQSAALADGENLSSWTVQATPLCSVNGAAPTQCPSASGSVPPTNTTYYVSVRVYGTYNSLLHYPGIPTNVPISGSALMRVIYQ